MVPFFIVKAITFAIISGLPMAWVGITVATLQLRHNAIVNTNLKGVGMGDLNPEIWNNPTLGEAAQNPRLDEIQAQEAENRAAELEGRKPRVAVQLNTFYSPTPPESSYDDGIRLLEVDEPEPVIAKVTPKGKIK